MATAAFSPSDSQGDEGLSLHHHDHDDDQRHHEPLQRRATIGDPVYDNQAIRQKRKAAVVACERCRRRKIRCDGNQPCATCARFGVRCAKPEERRERSSSNAEHAALADRVRLLEARLAAVTASEQAAAAAAAAAGGEDSSGARPGPPALHLDTSFDAELPRAMSFPAGMEDLSMSDDFLSPTNIPTIQITGPHGSHPSSPLALSPSPSLFSGTSRASSPDPFSAVSAFDFGGSNALGPSSLTPTGYMHIRTPPQNEWAEIYNHHNLHTPVSPGGQHKSRRSSISSFGGLGESFSPPHDHAATDWTMHVTSDAHKSFPDFGHVLPDPTTPSKSQAEMLADQVFGSRYLPIERSAFRVCLEAIYLLPSHDTDAPPAVQSMLAAYTTYSLRVARCLFFLVLSIGLRMNALAGGSSAGIDSCYQLAMQQMSQADFWTENGSREVADLLSAFAEVSRS